MSYEVIWDKDEVVISAPLHVTVTTEDVEDILSSAFGGGINYWCSAVCLEGEYLGDCASEHVSKGGSVRLYDAEDDKWFVLDRDTVVRGVVAYVDFIGADILDISGRKVTVNPGFVDADRADSIVQLAIFGDVIYA